VVAAHDHDGGSAKIDDSLDRKVEGRPRPGIYRQVFYEH